jgi:5S rRNA maturation endonuclease (ribonuclease M5)
MSNNAFERLSDHLRAAGMAVRDSGHGKAQAQCPAHDDGRASLSITGIDGQVLVYCHAGCNTADVLAALNLAARDLFDRPRGADYHYPDGRQVTRTPEKRFWQAGNTKGRSLFRTDFEGVDVVYVAEGEKDVLALESVGAVATCSAMGAGKADKFDWSPLVRKTVIIIADKDEPGRKHASQVSECLADKADSVRIVEAAVGKDAADHIAAGKTLDEFVSTPPATQEVSVAEDGAELLDTVQTFLARFVVYPSAYALVAHVLWIVHCWLMDSWESTPRIAFLSPEPGSGKSRALEVTEPLVPRPVHAVNTTPAYLFRKVSDEAGRPTILYDEIDTVFGPKAKDNEDIRGMLNAGHRKGAMAGRCVMRGKVVETEELPAYCAVMLAGLDDLPDTIMTRSVVVRMRRRAPGEDVEPWRPRINNPEAHALRDRLATWAVSLSDRLAGDDWWPDIPPEVTDRDADVWEALLAVADLAGGHWPETARRAAVALVAASKQRAPSVGVLLLRDIRTVFLGTADEPQNIDQLTTEQLLSALNRMDESPWPTIRRGEPLDSRGLSQRLSKYGIGSKLHAGERGLRGYVVAQFTDAWSRYLPDVSATSAPPATEPGDAGADVADVADKPGPTRAPCDACGAELSRPESVARGRCAECAVSDPEPVR